MNDEFEVFRNTPQNEKHNSDKIGFTSTHRLSESKEEIPIGNKPNILIIDDDSNVQTALKLTLGKKYDPILCSNGLDGINRVNSKICAVILDVKMEGKNGFETFIEIKEKNSYLPIIFHSAYQDIKNPYEIISDVVNLASRLEDLTKMYGASILISEITFQKLEDPSIYDYRIVDTVKVKGKKEPVTVIEILNGNSSRIIELKLTTKRDFEFGTALYQEKDFSEAQNCFRKVLEKDPSDKAAEIYLKRSEYYEVHGITPEWEGIEALENK